MVEHKKYIQGDLTFILTPTQTIVRTPLKQVFFLRPTSQQWKRRHELIRRMIEIDEIRSLQELAAYCSHGVHWEVTRGYQDE